MKSRHLLGIIVSTSILVTMLLSGPAYAISNGQPDSSNNWPFVGLVVFDCVEGVPCWRCTGTLLSPTVVLTAGHCAGDGAVAARVWFDWNVTGNSEYPFGGSTSFEGTPIAHPSYGTIGPGLPGFDTHDVGVVILSEPVPTSVVSEYGQLPSLGQVDTLSMMEDVDLVGYGVQEMNRGGGQPYWVGKKTRHFAPAQFIHSKHVINDEFMRLTANPAQGKGGTTFGDSGGAVFLGDTFTILAVNSFVNSYECPGVTYSNRIDTYALEWINGFL
jgi:hypothetical protein